MSKNLRNKDILFFCAYFLWISVYILDKTTLYNQLIPDLMFKVVRVLCITLLLIKIYYFDRFNIKELLVIISISTLTLFSIINSGDTIIGDTLLLILASKDISFKKVIRFTLILEVFLIFIVISSSLLGIVENRVFLRADGTLRNSFGFVYPTLLGVYFLHIVLMYLYLSGAKLRILDSIIILLLNYFVRTVTDSRTNYYLVIVSLVIFNLFIKGKIKVECKRLWKYLFTFSIPLCAMFSIVITLLYNENNNYWAIINEVLNNRLTFGKEAYQIYGLDLLGQKITMVGSAALKYGNYSSQDYFYIDSSYMQIALMYGIIFLIILCIGFYLICRREIKRGNISFCICILILAIHSIIEPQLFILSYNVFLIALRETFVPMSTFKKEIEQ